MTKQLSSGQGGIERRSGGIRTVQRGGVLGRTPMLPVEHGFRFMSPIELASLRPARVSERGLALNVNIRAGKGGIQIGQSMRFGRGSRGRLRMAYGERITELY